MVPQSDVLYNVRQYSVTLFPQLWGANSRNSYATSVFLWTGLSFMYSDEVARASRRLLLPYCCYHSVFIRDLVLLCCTNVLWRPAACELNTCAQLTLTVSAQDNGYLYKNQQ